MHGFYYRLTSIFFIISAFVLSIGCSSIIQHQSGESILRGSPQFKQIPLGSFQSDFKPGIYVLTGDSTAVELEEQLQDPDQQYNREVPQDFVLAIFSGVKPTGGFGIELNSIRRYGNNIKINAAIRYPPEDSFNIQAITQPTLFVPVSLPPGSYEVNLIAEYVNKPKEPLQDSKEFWVRNSEKF